MHPAKQRCETWLCKRPKDATANLFAKEIGLLITESEA